MTESEDDRPLPPGTKLGNYVISGLLGRGGMGTVYRASHARLGRKVAIKVLAPQLSSDKEFTSRFFHEAKIVSDVQHPSIVDVTDFIESDEPRYVAYVMELIEAPSLLDVVRQKPLTEAQAINASLQLLNALEAVHKLGVVHRDLKPENILVVAPLESDFSQTPCLKILDFGIAKVADPKRAHKTATGFMLGTPGYMAPEQFDGTRISAKTDIYAFGELLYEMLTCRKLFRGDMQDMFRAKLDPNPPDLSELTGVLEEETFREIVRRCVALDPLSRPRISELETTLLALLPKVQGRVSGLSSQTLVRAGKDGFLDTQPRLDASFVQRSPVRSMRRHVWLAIVIGLLLATAEIYVFYSDELRAKIWPAQKVEAPAAVVPDSPPASTPKVEEKKRALPTKAAVKASTKKAPSPLPSPPPPAKTKAPLKKEELPPW